jgi:hypothetical protein
VVVEVVLADVSSVSLDAVSVAVAVVAVVLADADALALAVAAVSSPSSSTTTQADARRPVAAERTSSFLSMVGDSPIRTGGQGGDGSAARVEALDAGC